MQQGGAGQKTKKGGQRENELNDRTRQHDERCQSSAAGAFARDSKSERDQPETSG